MAGLDECEKAICPAYGNGYIRCNSPAGHEGFCTWTIMQYFESTDRNVRVVAALKNLEELIEAASTMLESLPNYSESSSAYQRRERLEAAIQKAKLSTV